MGNCTTVKHLETEYGDTRRQESNLIDEAATYVSAETHISPKKSFDYEDTRIVFYELVYKRKWSEATEVLDNSQHAPVAGYMDHYKRCPLHWACIKGATTQFLNKLIMNFPQATIMRDYLGRTPLHLLCEFGTDQAMTMLLRATDPVVTNYRDSKFMRTLLAEAIVNCRSPMIIDAILQANTKQIVQKDAQNNTVLEMFFRKKMGSILCFSRFLNPKINVDDLIEIGSILLQAEIEERFDVELNDHRINILSNAIQSPSTPFAFIKYILSEMPHLAGICDANGNLPIHAACRIKNQDGTLYTCDDCSKSQMSDLLYYFNQENSCLREVLCQNCIRVDETNFSSVPPSQKMADTTNALLSLDTTFAKTRSSENELPLMIALKSGQSWASGALQELVDAYPPAISQKDVLTELYPFQLAASTRDYPYGVNKKQWDLESLNTIFKLLLIWPMTERS